MCTKQFRLQLTAATSEQSILKSVALLVADESHLNRVIVTVHCVSQFCVQTTLTEGALFPEVADAVKSAMTTPAVIKLSLYLL